MMQKAQNMLEKNVKFGGLVTTLLIALAVIGAIMWGTFQSFNYSVYTLPKKNAEEIAAMKTEIALQKNCIENLQNGITEIKNSNNEIQKNIIDILKAVK